MGYRSGEKHKMFGYLRGQLNRAMNTSCIKCPLRREAGWRGDDDIEI
jgi:hypothetical protein